MKVYRDPLLKNWKILITGILAKGATRPHPMYIRHWNTMQTSSSSQRNMLTLRCNSSNQLISTISIGSFQQVLGGGNRRILFIGSWNPRFLPIFIDVQAVATGDSPSCAARMGGKSLQHITLITNTYSNKPSAQPKANRGSWPESTSRKPQGICLDKVRRVKKTIQKGQSEPGSRWQSI